MQLKFKFRKYYQQNYKELLTKTLEFTVSKFNFNNLKIILKIT